MTCPESYSSSRSIAWILLITSLNACRDAEFTFGAGEVALEEISMRGLCQKSDEDRKWGPLKDARMEKWVPATRDFLKV